MDRKPFLGRSHYIAKALSDIRYPISKEDLIKSVGEVDIKVDWNKYEKLKKLIEPIRKDRFDNAACFYSSLHSLNK